MTPIDPASLYELVEDPQLERPVLIQQLSGWIDAGAAAQSALNTIVSQIEPVVLARFDTDQLLDHRARRPTMSLVDGVHAGLTWPAIEIHAATDPEGTEFLLLSGHEPDHAWRAFSEAVVDLAYRLGARMVVGMGAYPAPAAHTRSVGLATTATEASLASQVGFVGGSILVPAGVQAAIEDACGQNGLPAVGLWAQVPHYAAAMPYPAAAASLIRGVNDLAELQLSVGDLDDEARETRRRIDELVANSDEHRAMVAQLEHQTDALVDTESDQLPTGEELAAELQAFLRDQDNE